LEGGIEDRAIALGARVGIVPGLAAAARRHERDRSEQARDQALHHCMRHEGVGSPFPPGWQTLYTRRRTAASGRTRQAMGLLEGKRALIVGVASNRSIAWGIAQAMRREGAELAFSYQTEKLADRVRGFAAELESDIALPLDVADDGQIDAFFDALAARWDGFDILVHSVAFAPSDQLEGRYIDVVNREG